MTNLDKMRRVKRLKTAAHLLNCPETKVWESGNDAHICQHAEEAIKIIQEMK